jgi:hypothetical protein
MNIRVNLVVVFLFVVPFAFSASVASDGFPTGQDTAEGVAADLARAFIKFDFSFFEKICVPLYGDKKVKESYEDFRADVKKSMKQVAKMKVLPPGGPKSIGKVFAARRLSLNGPSSYGYAAFGFEDVQFVDVGVFLVSGERSLNRTLVIKKGGKWFVHPVPSISPLLCTGLNEETESETDWREKEQANQALLPTPMSVTRRADARHAPATGAADL